MREIKFRGRNENGWHYGLLTFMFNDYAISHVEDENTVDLIDKETIGQYTNQKNHEDKEIYEGDYVSKEIDNSFDYGAFEGVVDLIDGKWVINNRVNHYEELFTEAEQIEILGNIHDNPELLEVQNG